MSLSRLFFLVLTLATVVQFKIYGGPSSTPAGTVEPRRPPSSLLDSEEVRSRSAAFVLFQNEDLRTFYCTFETLTRRKTNKLAVLDNLKDGREIAVGEAETVQTFLMKSGKSDLWQRSWQPQARLITTDAIYQSPASFDPVAKAAFLHRPVQPGDILVLTLMD